MDMKAIEESHHTRLLSELANMRRDENLCDVKLSCGSTSFSVHSCVLAASSPYFKSLFETQPNEESTVVPTDGHTMVIFLDYLYTGKFNFDPNDLASNLIAAHLFQLPEIYEYCLSKVGQFINVHNFTNLWKAAEKCSDKELQETITKYCCDNVDSLLEGKFIGKCSNNLIKAFSTSQILSPEITIHCVMVWLQYDPINRKSYLQPLWNDIALPTPTVKTLLDKELFSKSPDFVTSIKNIMSLDADHNGKGQASTDKVNENPEETKTPPLPPRSLSIKMRKSLPPMPPMPPIQQIPETPNIFNRTAPDSVPDSVPAPPPRSLSLLPVAVGESHLLIFAVTRHKRIALQKYNLEKQTWSPSEDFPLPKQYAIPPVFTSLQDKIYILGGGISTIDFDSSVYVTSVSEYARRELCSMLLPRVHFGIASLNGLLYVIGGRNRTGWLRDVERFNPDQNVWHQMAPLSEPKSALAVTVVQGRVYVIGGLKGTKLFSTTTESYDPLADQWTQVEPMTLGRYRVGIAALNKNIYVLGGAKELPETSNNFLMFDTCGNLWKNFESPDTFKDDQPCMVTWNNKLWVISRKNYSLFTYDPSTCSWEKLDTTPATRHWQYIKTILQVSL